MRSRDRSLSHDTVEITSFQPGDGPLFKTLNEEWLRKYFVVEPLDEAVLGNPQGEIIDRGGFIFFIHLKGKVVGTVALIKVDERTFELSKMAVTASAQGRGLGKHLLEHAIAFAEGKGARKLVLYTSRKLHPALHLYHWHGFVEVPLDHSGYERAEVKMERMLGA
ncbi:MAG TPA: GNAT family N-acetyltransferase [Flavobacteriales bacterium]|nr:GNAT family N-acetyltransferase [Flavobacteriales bacterium]